MKHRLAPTALLLAASLVIAGCASGGESPPPGKQSEAKSLGFSAQVIEALGGQENVDYMTELYDKAVADGQKTITVYGGTATSSAPLYKRFSERFPDITVEHVTIFGPELQNRIASEQATGKYVADNVSVNGADALFVAENDFVAEQNPQLASKLPKKSLPFKNTLFGANTFIYTVSYNTDLVKESDVPRTFDDFLDPKWAGKVAVGNMGAGAYGMLLGAPHQGVIGEAWLKKFAASGPVILPSEREVFTAVSTGQVPIGLNTYIRGEAFLDAENLPVAFVADFEDGIGDGVFYRGTVKNAPNAIASDLLTAWWLSPEAMELLSIGGQAGLMPGAPAITGQPPLDKIKVNETPSIGDDDYKEASNKWLGEFRRIFKM